jgi:hypothetical protein
MRATFEDEDLGPVGSSVDVEVLGLWLRCSGDGEGFVDLAVGNSSDSTARVRVRRVGGPVIFERLLRSRQERLRFAATPGRYRVELEAVGTLDPDSSREDWRVEIGGGPGSATRVFRRATSHTFLTVG